MEKYKEKEKNRGQKDETVKEKEVIEDRRMKQREIEKNREQNDDIVRGRSIE